MKGISMENIPLKSIELPTPNKRFFLLGIVIIAIYITGLLLWKNRYQEPIDPVPTLQQLDLKTQKKASKITVGLHINKFPSFSFVENNFVIDATLWFRFPRGAESLDTLDEFAIQNSLLQENGELLYKSKPIIKLIDEDVLICYHIQTAFKASADFHDFPLQSHNISIMIQNKNITPHELYLHSSDEYATSSSSNFSSSWRLRKAYVKTGYISAPLSKKDPAMEISYPAAVFTFNLEGIGIRDLISLYFPMFVIFFIGLFSLLVSISEERRLSYVAGAVPTLVLFRLVIDGASPHVAYTTHIDFVFYLLVLLSLFILFFNTYVILTLQKIKLLTASLQKEALSTLQTCNTAIFWSTLGALSIAMTYACI